MIYSLLAKETEDLVIYSKMPEYDVYVMRNTQGKLGCYMCKFGDLIETVFHPESTQEMLDHIAAHDRAGDKVPLGILTQLVADDLTNFPHNPMPTEPSS